MGVRVPPPAPAISNTYAFHAGRATGPTLSGVNTVSTSKGPSRGRRRLKTKAPVEGIPAGVAFLDYPRLLLLVPSGGAGAS